MEVTRDMRVDLTCGYLFRPVTPDLGIKDAPFSSSAAESRLKSYLKEMGADNGETLHGFRSGCAITLALTGADLAEIMDLKSNLYKTCVGALLEKPYGAC